MEQGVCCPCNKVPPECRSLLAECQPMAEEAWGATLRFWEGFWKEIEDPAADGWSQVQLCQFGHQRVGEDCFDSGAKIDKNQPCTSLMLLKVPPNSPESCCSSFHLLALEANWCGAKAVGRMGMMWWILLPEVPRGYMDGSYSDFEWWPFQAEA